MVAEPVPDRPGQRSSSTTTDIDGRCQGPHGQVGTPFPRTAGLVSPERTTKAAAVASLKPRLPRGGGYLGWSQRTVPSPTALARSSPSLWLEGLKRPSVGLAVNGSGGQARSREKLCATPGPAGG